MYKQPGVESSYAENDLGRTLYTVVMALRPKVVVEVGTLHGYSAIAMAQALRDLGGPGDVECFDLWDAYEYKHAKMSDTLMNVLDHKLEERIRLHDGTLSDAINWYHNSAFGLKSGVLFHIDISNDGDIIKNTVEAIGKDSLGILFEGGTEERNNIEWMKKYNKTPITKECCDYRVIDDRFPSISLVG